MQLQFISGAQRQRRMDQTWQSSNETTRNRFCNQGKDSKKPKDFFFFYFITIKWIRDKSNEYND